MSIISVPTINAQTAGQMKSYAFLAVEPNPVGVGQTTYIAMWIDVPLPGSSEANDIRKHDYQLVITAPDGTVQTQSWAVVADTTGIQSTAFTPTMIGQYNISFSYPDQKYTWNSSTYLGNNAYTGIIFLGASAKTTLTVQQNPVPLTGDSPLPTEYWTRPIYGEDSSWYTVGSQWLGSGSSYTTASSNYFGSFQQGGMNLWQQGGTGPETSHIVWTRPYEDGGVVGGINTGITGATFYSGGSYEGRFQNGLIINGRLYYKAPLGDQVSTAATGGGAYTCLDLRTGQVLWTNPSINPTFGELYDYESPNQHGVIPNGYLWQSVAQSSTTQTWIAYDSLTGSWLFNLTDVPSTGTIAYTSQGEIVKYILNYNNTAKSGSLALWNWTSANGVPASSTTANGVQLNGPGSGTNYLQFRPVGRVINASTAYSWNISIGDIMGPGNSILTTGIATATQNPTIQFVLPGDILFGTTPNIAPGVLSLRGTPNPYTVWTISLADTNKGTLLWKKTYDAPAGNMTLNLGPIDPVNRVWTTTTAEDMQYQGYSLSDGSKMWATNTEVPPLQWFSSGSGAGQRCVTAYGNIYTQGFGGEILAFDTKTGSLLWRFNDTDSGVDTPWGNIPTFIAAIADGKIYAFNNEHSPNAPLYKGYSIYCLNATNGDEIYKMLSWAGQTGGQGLSTSILADGTLVYYNYYSNSLYAIAKGPSQTTVTASPKVSAHGDKVLVEGTVIDLSAGTKQTEQAARFPSGVPAVSDESQSAWMEYIYMQQPRPAATGVPVTLSVLDPNNNLYTVGTTTSDAMGAFKLAFDPSVPGEYTIYATFAGSGSYYGSSAETAIYVGEAAATSTPQPTQSPSMSDLYFVPGIIGVIVAIIVVGAVLALLLLKKRP